MNKAPTRVAILADTHGFLDQRVAEQVATCDIAIHAGDVGGADILFALHPREEVIAIRGNNDDDAHWAIAERDTLANLPTETTVRLPGGEIKVVHGDDGGTLEQRHRRYRRQYADCRAVVYGHSHRQLVEQQSTPWLLNPGAAGRTRTYGGPGCLILTCYEADWQIEPMCFEPRNYRTHRSRSG
ncbi:MAG: metallophosphoesterase family protein [Spiribacter sp.]|jgi:putative phosphoesterase|nr:metallophosphoesterase family protein [Spiribacter sp.]MDR9490016.1 metallophosphoesterase family protein [Spiribacter sp.]